MKYLLIIIKALFGGLLDKVFPPKTAANEKVKELTGETQAAVNANEISNEVDQESRADIDHDLSKFVRGQN